MPLRRLQNALNLATPLTRDHLLTLPLLVLYLTDGCNSRCIMCDIWHRPRRNMSAELIDSLLGQADSLNIGWLLLSGGEAMQHPQWSDIARRFRALGVRVMLLTNGLYVRRQYEQIIEHVDDLIISLDAADGATYQMIRGVDALAPILEGMQLCAEGGVRITTRTTVQSANFQQMPAIIRTALDAGAHQVSFLPIDVSSDFAFGERSAQGISDPSLLSVSQTAELEGILHQMTREFAREFETHQIAESPAKLRRTLLEYFRAWHGLGDFPPPPCNAPHFSVVVEVDGTLRPCYFLPSMGKFQPDQSLRQALNQTTARDLRRQYRTGQRAECARCVCPLYKSSRDLLHVR